ncbi:MAG: leucyl aminopeptidase family protein [Deltaproteobacteria bacterium]|nr:leucyl aminopeptidase family protein [Deltaproteobacteria bacterium]
MSVVADLPALLQDAQTLVVAARRADLIDGWPLIGLPAAARDAAARLAADAKPSMGGSVSTLLPLVDGQPRSLVIVPLYDKISRHLSETRALELYLALRGTARPDSGKVAILLGLREAAHATGAYMGVSRAYPHFSRKTGGKPSTHPVAVLCATAQGAVTADLEAIRAAGKAARLAQRLVDLPAADLDTVAFETETRRAVEGLPHVTTTSLVGDDLLARGLRGLHAVGRSAMAAPRLVICDYDPPDAQGEPIALIGKGLVYDTGGLFLKIAETRMLTMKCDMGGAAAMLGAFLTLTASGIKRRIILGLAMAENGIGPDAYRPDDIIEMHSGKTMEVNNTDAEGRICVADAASYVARTYRPKVLIDAATLTGAQLFATGKYHAAIVTNDAELEAAAIAAGLSSGDHCMPILYSPELHTSEYKSAVADMRNSVADRTNASSSASGLWIYMHIDDLDLRWCHIDLAGPAFLDNRATGYGVGLIDHLVRAL